jgi:phosphoribosylaminoimidazole-succinocarboxamide synthase
MADDRLVYRGKSKDVYEIADGEYAGKYRFVFTDKATGYMQDGVPVFDPGYDVVVGEIPGKGAIACKFATYFFRLLKEKNIPSHYIETVGENEMIVEPATPLGMQPQAPEFEGSESLPNLEFTWRNNAMGSFWRRYPFIKPGQNLHKVVEAWTKGGSDTLITYEALEEAKVMTRDEINQVDSLVKDIAEIVSREFESRGLHIIDGKFELGRLVGGDGKIVLIDEISPDVLRVCRGYNPDQEGNCTAYQQCIKTKLLDGKRKISGKNQLKADEVKKIFLGENA